MDEQKLIGDADGPRKIQMVLDNSHFDFVSVGSLR